MCTLGAPARADASPLLSRALWVTHASTPAALASAAGAAGVRTLFVKAADGSSPEPQFTPALVAGLRAQGMSVCAWTFAYGADPAGEASVAVAAVRSGAECLIVDAEGAYDGRYGAAQSFVRALRRELGAAFPIALAGQAEVLEHPGFPYSVFLGPGGFQADLPLLYWRDLGLGVQAALRTAIAQNAIYGRPIAPVGQLYGGVSGTEAASFATVAGRDGCPASSFFDLDVAEPAQLAALRGAPAARHTRTSAPATIRPGADGDEVLWAQELLNAAGANLPVGGFFGPQTAHALATFQGRHRLRRTGVLDAASWRALLRLHAREPSWASGPPLSAGAAQAAAAASSQSSATRASMRSSTSRRSASR